MRRNQKKKNQRQRQERVLFIEAAKSKCPHDATTTMLHLRDGAIRMMQGQG